jgi:hypothetical protein
MNATRRGDRIPAQVPRRAGYLPYVGPDLSLGFWSQGYDGSPLAVLGIFRSLQGNLVPIVFSLNGTKGPVKPAALLQKSIQITQPVL